MKQLVFETWDNGRLTVNRDFAHLLRANALTTTEAFLRDDVGEVAKNLLPERTTFRMWLSAPPGEQEFFLKRHLAPPWKEYVKPLLRCRRPILGARNEWRAIGHFLRAGIPTMTPVAYGEAPGASFLMTQGIRHCRKLSEWMESCLSGHPSAQASPEETQAIVDGAAELARRMHTAGLHHQDFYLAHLLLPTDDFRRGIHVIDLGRARRRRLLATRWIVKDLAQLNYSARLFPGWARRRFLETYLHRRLRRSDQGWIRRIERKTARIARHDRKGNL